MSRLHPSTALLCGMAAFLGACTSTSTSTSTSTGTGTAPSALDARTTLLERTTHGVAHITAPDMETLAYGVAYAHAQDNVCQTAQQLLTVRGERSKFLGGEARGLLGLRALPNEQIDFFIAAHMDDAALAQAWARSSGEAQAMLRGYVAGYNRYLAEHASHLPAACVGQPWVRPMTEADMRRLSELSSVQAGIAALADSLLAAQPPSAPTAQASPTPELPPLALAAAEMRERGLLDSPYGSNAWAFGKDSSANGRGLLLGNPHFPWVGVNRFWQLHLTIPGQLDVMGAAIGHGAVVQIGFNKDVAWSHTVSTGKRFTLHELTLVPGQVTQYVVDGQPEAMRSRSLSIQVKQADGRLAAKTHTVWETRWGPVVVVPNARLGWTAQTAYALKDANRGNARSVDTWLALNRATSVADMRQGLANLGTPWVNTIAADRHGQALYADASVVPDVDAAHLQRCAPSAPAAALFKAAGLVVLNGSRSDCDWRQDHASAVPGLTPISRLPMAVRTDWVHNSNDSFFYSHPAQKFEGISPLVGDTSVNRPRTRAGLTEILQMLSRGKASPASVQQQLFANHNFIGAQVVPDLLAACQATPPSSADAREGCVALEGWDLSSNGEARGAHLFREFWRTARSIPQIHRVPFDAAQPVATPTGLKMADEAVATKIWEALAGAVKKVKNAGFALDAPLASVQRPAITDQAIGLHGGDEIEGVLNNLGDRAAPGIGAKGLLIDYGTSYVQTVTFDEHGPLAQALLTYGQSSNPQSPHATDQLRRYAAKQWPVLPFLRADIEQTRLAPPLTLTRP